MLTESIFSVKQLGAACQLKIDFRHRNSLAKPTGWTSHNGYAAFCLDFIVAEKGVSEADRLAKTGGKPFYAVAPGKVDTLQNVFVANGPSNFSNMYVRVLIGKLRNLLTRTALWGILILWAILPSRKDRLEPGRISLRSMLTKC